jgi:phytoene dehydrogenase-like protein
MTTITVIGGGLAGLVASIECAERGADVVLHEAQSHLGGRARSTVGDFTANHGPHVVYADGALWTWLDARGLARPARRPPVTGVRFRHHGSIHRTPPLHAVQALRLLRRDAPDDISFREWLDREAGATVADVASRLCHVFTFHHDPGSFAASFVAERARRAFTLPPTARYIVGGWGALVDRLVDRARELGVRIDLQSKVDAVPTDGPAIVATELRAARALLGDDTLTWPGARTACFDVGLRTRRGDPFLVLDLDAGVFAERYTAPDRTLAPTGHQLVQAQVGIPEGATLEDGVRTIEAVLDQAFPTWREREVWRRRFTLTDASGALDPVGTTWRDRPAVDRGDGVLLCGDMVAAPGLLGEVSVASAVEAATLASNRAGSPRRSTLA